MSKLYLQYVEGGLPVVLHGILCLLAYLVWSFFFIVAAPVMAVFRLFKLFEYALISYQKLGTVFSTLDLPFLHETENNRNYIVGMIEVEGELNIDKLRKMILARLFDQRKGLDETYKRLAQKVTRRYLTYIWTDEENFNIKQHMPVYKGALPNSKEDLLALYSKFTAEQLPKNISPWLFRAVPKEDRTSMYIFCKFHHVIGDGFAMVGLLSQLVDNKPEFINLRNKKDGFMANPIKRVVTGILTGPLALLTLMFSLNFKNPFRASITPEKKTVSWTTPISLSLVKNMKEKTGTTVNDVLMSCLAGAIRQYLIKHKAEMPIDLPIAMTFNQRSVKEKNRIKDRIPLGNHSGGLFLNLPVSKADSVERLNITRSRMNKLKALSHPHLFSFIYFNVVGGLPEVFGRMSTYSVNRHASLICSNVPGPVDTLYILGKPIKSIVFTPPLHADMGLVVSFFSYNNVITLTVLSDEHIIAQPSKLTGAFENEVKLLAERILIDD